MTRIPAGTPNDPSTLSLKERLDRAQHELAVQRVRTNRASVATLIIGLIAVVALSIYFYIGYTWIAWGSQPERLADLADQMADENLPEIRQNLEAEIVKSAPSWAQGLSKQAQDS